jgi:hypothetical protein
LILTKVDAVVNRARRVAAYAYAWSLRDGGARQSDVQIAESALDAQKVRHGLLRLAKASEAGGG